MKELDQEKWDIHYVGSHNGIEKELITNLDIPYYAISSGKLRRYVDMENVKDVFRVVKGVGDARRVLKKLKPSLVFSKGGFVTVPVIMAAKSLNIPVFIHESDLTPGLANKIAQRFATKIFTSFDEAAAYFPKEKCRLWVRRFVENYFTEKQTTVKAGSAFMIKSQFLQLWVEA